jgi:hypothetical protein
VEWIDQAQDRGQWRALVNEPADFIKCLEVLEQWCIWWALE